MRARRVKRARTAARRFHRRHRRLLGHALLVSLAAITLGFVGCLTREQPGIRQSPPPDQNAKPSVDRSIRVRLLGAQPVPSFNLEIASACRVRDTQTGKQLISLTRPMATAKVAPAGRSVMLGSTRCDTDDLLIEPGRDASIVVDGKTYRGSLRIRRSADGLTATNLVDVEDYLRGVLRGELPAHFHAQAQRALAVAARTYVFYEKLTAPPGRDYDVLADERSQMYIGVKGEDAAAVRAVDDTVGEVCLVRVGGTEKVFSTYYSSSCGGMTQPVLEFRPGDPDVPTLAGNVVCNDCYLAPSYQWNPVRMSKAEITRRVVARYPRLSRLGQITRVSVEDRGKSGRATKIMLVGSGGASEILVGEDFRLCLGGHVLKSTRFKIVDEGSKIRFVDGRGFGHGVGLCQYGADRKAKLGKSYREILECYYPGVIIRSVY